MNQKQIINITEDIGIVPSSIPVCLFLEPQVRISSARHVAHSLHASCQMHPEGCTARLQSIQHVDHNGLSATIISKLFPKSGPDFLSARCSNVGIQHICSPHVNIVQHCHQQGYSNGLSGHNAGISEGCRSLRCMSPGYEPGLASKILHLNIKDHVAAYKL